MFDVDVVAKQLIGLITGAVTPIRLQLADVAARLAAVEAAAPVAGPMGPPGDAGPPGLPGRDGSVGPAGPPGGLDLTAVFDGERTLLFSWGPADGRQSLAVALPFPLYRGVYLTDHQYDVGDCVTWNGALWLCTHPTTARPGQPGQASRAWTLAIKGPKP